MGSRISSTEHQAWLAARSKGRKPIEVLLMREGPHWRNIGLVLNADSDPGCVVIDAVEPQSLIDDWNRANDDYHQVKPGDQITSVNGRENQSGDAMLGTRFGLGRGAEIRLKVN